MRSCNQCGRSCDDEHRFCPSCGFPIGALRAASGDPMIGRTIGAGYTILEAVGAGGMGKVYRAERGALGKTLAVKVIHPHLAGDDNAVKRFNQEAQTSSMINHPNAVVVLDFGRTDDERLYLVMEFLRGRDLTRVVWEQGRLPVERASDILRQVLAALSEAHRLGIVHRDIKPENILVEPLATGGDFVKVVDFGLAKIRGDQSPGVTSPGLVSGTPDYMAPEQARGLAPDPRSDLYAAAVVLYQCVTGRLPFEADTADEVLKMHVNADPPDPRTYVPELPQRFVDVLLRALHKDLDARFQSAVDFAEALRVAAIPDAHEAVAQTPCPRCGEGVVQGAHFCGHCGQPMRAPSAAPAARDDAAQSFAVLPLVEREEALSLLELGLSRAAQGSLVPVAIAGDEGAGRTRLVETFAENARARGLTTVIARPDPNLAGVSYHAVQQAIRSLFGIGAGEEPIAWVERRQLEDPSLDSSLHAGFLEIFTGDGPVELDAEARNDAAVRALAYAILSARVTRGDGPVILAFVHAHRLDGASLRVLRALMARSMSVPSLLLVTCSHQLVSTLPRCETVTLRPLSTHGVSLLVSAARSLVALEPEALGDGELQPLHVEQLLRWHADGGGDAPSRLVDLIALRVERLSARARRLLPCVAVLGTCDTAEASRALGAEVDDALFESLKVGGWIAPVADAPDRRWRVAHPLFVDVLNDCVPASVRAELHRAALSAEDRALPIEVEALHAEQTSSVFLALLKLGQVGERAIARGDNTTAAHALRRGLELARREYLKGDADVTDDTLSLFARKLGEALVAAGDHAEAEGVLREGLGVALNGSQEWIRLQCVLGRAYFLRGRHSASDAAFDAATTAATRQRLPALAVEILMARAELEVSAGADEWALRTLTRAEALLDAALAGADESHPLWRQRAEVLLWLSRAKRVVGEVDAALLERARTLAQRAELRVLHAQCDAEAAELAELGTDRRLAQRLWQRASRNAREAGDVALAETYEQRLRRLGVH